MSADLVYCATCGAANPPDAMDCFACGNPPLVAVLQPHASAAPALLRQRYRLLAQVGSGGFGAVYRAEDVTLGNRTVAVKEMSQRGLTPEEAQEATTSFRNEALLLAGLTHPNLPGIYEQFEEGGRWYLVMDFIEGETLEDRLSRMPGGRLPVAEALKIGLQLCTVLDYLHTRQPPIIFRDLKPANIMLTPDGALFLIDFGIARHFKPGQTRDTIAFGSAGYAAPEQYGKAQTTTQSDVYSLGATLHHLLSGSDPANSPFIFGPLHLPAPDGLEALLMQMVDTDPSQRPASMAVVKHDLERLADDLATGRTRQKPPARPALSPSGEVLRPLVVYRGHFDTIQAVAWSPDGTLIASGGRDQTMHIWESASGRKRHALPQAGVVSGVVWSPSGDELTWASGVPAILSWNTRAKSVYDISYYRLFATQSLRALSWSPDGTCFAAAGLGNVEVWDVKASKRVLTYKGHRGFFQEVSISAVAWSPDGEWIASGSRGAVQVWRAATGEMRCIYRDYQSRYSGGLAWSPNSVCLASVGSNETVHVWDAATGSPYKLLRGHSKTVNAVAWSPDGQYLASGSSDQRALVWDVAAGKEATWYTHREGLVDAIAWSPDGTCIASAGDDHMVHIWQAR